jgi:GDPmannose 4,6-dehydratase
VRQFVELAAAELGIRLSFTGCGEQEVGTVAEIAPTNGETRAHCKVGDIVVRVDPRYYRPTEVESLLGDFSRAREKLGWAPRTTLPQLVREMVQSDYTAARRDNMVKLAGFKAYDYNE